MQTNGRNMVFENSINITETINDLKTNIPIFSTTKTDVYLDNCETEMEESVKRLITSFNDDRGKCIVNFDYDSKSVIEFLSNYNDDVNNLREYINNEFESCKQNDDCLYLLLNEIAFKVFDFIEKVKLICESSFKFITYSFMTSLNCVITTEYIAYLTADQIVNNFKVCVNDHADYDYYDNFK